MEYCEKCIPFVYKATLKAAYELGHGQSLPTPVTLVGTITRIDTAWSNEYENITVTIEYAGQKEWPIMCYRLTGEGADSLSLGDTITVTGIIKNYRGTIEFDRGCTLDAVVKGK